jgi:hypothetical protein
MSDTSDIRSSVESQLAEYVDGLPNLSGDEPLIAKTIEDATRRVPADPHGTPDAYAAPG